MTDTASSFTIIVVFALSIALGRVLKIRIPRAVFQAMVLVLVWSISVWSAASGIEALKASLAHTLAFLALIILSVLVVGAVFVEEGKKSSSPVHVHLNSPIILAVPLGWLTGIYASWLRDLLSRIIWPLVLAVIFATGLTMQLSITSRAVRSGGRIVLKALSATITSAFLAGLAASFVLRVPLNYSLSIVFGLGWYSFAGPFVAQHFGPVGGLTAFLVNVMREQATLILTPVLARFKVSTVSLGGATTMDNTLPIYIYTYGEEATVPSIIHGFILTLLVPVLETLAIMIPA